MPEPSPQIKINQIWTAPDREGNPLRRVRILAPFPDGGWIIWDLPSRMAIGHIGWIKEFNLRKVFHLEIDVCDHHRTDKSEVPGPGARDDSPRYWRCNTCGDLFPLIGDSDFWFPKQIIRDHQEPPADIVTVYADGHVLHIAGPNPGTPYTQCGLDAGAMLRKQRPIEWAGFWCAPCVEASWKS